MSKIDYIQTSFAGGEFGPSLFGRTDVAQYANACEIVENMLVRPFGSVISCPGTNYVAAVKTSASKTRLIPFVFNQSDSYIIEMGVGYFRFYTNGAVVVSSGTTPYELAHTFTESELFDVQFAQLNDVIWLTHSAHPPMKLTRLAANSWTIAEFPFIAGPYLDWNTTAITITPSGSSGTVNLVLSATTSTISFVPSSSSTRGHVNTYWAIGGTAVTDSSTKLGVQGYVKITTVTNATSATASVIKILDIASATDEWAEGAWSDVNGWPSCVVFHERRLFFARTDEEPQKVWGSKSYVFDDFGLDDSNDDDALNLPLASNESNEIQWLASGKSLIAGTYGGSFVINSGSAEPITPTNANASQEASWGTEAIQPKRIGNYFYFVQRFGKKLRELFYHWELDSYKATDKTILSPHITGDGIVDMCYQQVPETMLWCVRTDGTLAVMTREVDQEVQAWSRHTTDGSYESVASIPSQSGSSDEVWTIVNRTISGSTVRMVEYFDSIEVPDRQDKCQYLHSALQYDAYTASSTGTLSLSATAGTTVVFTSSVIKFQTNDAGQRIRAIDADGNTLGEAVITSYSTNKIVTARIVYPFSTTSYAATRWGVSVNSVSGLTHLNAKTVRVLADGGMDRPDKVVSSGTITLANDYFVVNVGLPYTQTIYTLPVEAGSRRGTAQGKKQRINEVGFKVNRSYKGFYTGGDANNLDKIQFRDPTTLMGTPEALFTGIIPNISFRDDYQYGSQVMIKNYDPLPIEILSIMSTVDTFDK